jgi:hypothetical protein
MTISERMARNVLATRAIRAAWKDGVVPDSLSAFEYYVMVDEMEEACRSFAECYEWVVRHVSNMQWATADGHSEGGAQ